MMRSFLYLSLWLHALLSPCLWSASKDYFGEVYEKSGSVRLYRKLRPLDLKLDADVFHRDRVKTGQDSLLGIDVYDGSQLVVSPNTRMTLTRSDANEPRKINLQLISGTIRCKVKPLSDSEVFIVRTPVATAGVRGTDFITSYDRIQGLKVTVLEGEVEIVALREIQGQIRSQLMRENQRIGLDDAFQFSPKDSVSPQDRSRLEAELPLPPPKGGDGSKEKKEEAREDGEGGDQASVDGKLRVRRLKQSLQTVTTESRQNLFRDTINQSQRQSEEASVIFQFNLVNP